MTAKPPPQPRRKPRRKLKRLALFIGGLKHGVFMTRANYPSYLLFTMENETATATFEYERIDIFFQSCTFDLTRVVVYIDVMLVYDEALDLLQQWHDRLIKLRDKLRLSPYLVAVLKETPET